MERVRPEGSGGDPRRHLGDPGGEVGGGSRGHCVTARISPAEAQPGAANGASGAKEVGEQPALKCPSVSPSAPWAPQCAPPFPQCCPGLKCSPDLQMSPHSPKCLSVPSLAPVFPKSTSGTPSYPTRSQVIPRTPILPISASPNPSNSPREPVPRGAVQCQHFEGPRLPSLKLSLPPARLCSGPAPAMGPAPAWLHPLQLQRR